MLNKIVTLKKLLFCISNFKKLGKKLVFVTGCFDILHPAHKLFLRKAKTKGDILVVGLETDQRVKTMKGAGRPANLWPVRANNLAKVAAVDFVFPLPYDINRPQVQSKLLASLKPDILVVSSHTSHLSQKEKLVKRHGGQLQVVLKRIPGFSTSEILNHGQ